MASFATLGDIENIWRALTEAEVLRATQLLPIVSDCLRAEALKVGKNIDEMMAGSDEYKNVVKSVTVDVVARVLMTPTNDIPQTQYSQSAMGYTVSGTYLVPGGGLFVKKSELARLGFRRQRIGIIDMMAGEVDA